jgi:tripartite-type tricarboxylate transporter receptor subunit TctC
MKASVCFFAGLASLLLAGIGFAQTLPPGATAGYPTRSVRVIVPYAAGGPTDAIARTFAQHLSEQLGRPFYVENHAGASGNIGTSIALNAIADGHTVLFATNDLAVRHNSIKDFVPVTLVADSPEVIVVHPSLPARSVKELVALVRANPGKYNFASPGSGTSTHLAAERLFKLTNGLDLVHVPFNGGAPAIASTIGGHTLIAFTTLPPAAPHIREGTLRALAVTSNKRSPAFPEVPTLEEAGFPDHQSNVMVGVVVPVGTPKDIVDLLSRQIAQAAALPEVNRYFMDLGFEPIVDTPEEFAAWLKAEIAKWDKVVRTANIKLD